METLTIDEMTIEVRRSTRRHTMALSVERNGSIVVRAPGALPADKVREWAYTKRLWVQRKLTRKRAVAERTSPLEFVRGERFSYLGRTYPLKLVAQQDQPLRFDGRWFLLRRDARVAAPDHFRRWYVRVGIEWLAARVGALTRRAGTAPKAIAVRDLGFRWGSCGKHGVLLFNWKVLQLPVRLVDYVIVHELIHLRERSHGAEFWRAMERAVPDWEERREELLNAARECLAFGVTERERGDIPGG